MASTPGNYCLSSWHCLMVVARLIAKADRLWARDLSRDKSPVMELFGGQLQGNIVCHKCKSRFTKCVVCATDMVSSPGALQRLTPAATSTGSLHNQRACSSGPSTMGHTLARPPHPTVSAFC